MKLRPLTKIEDKIIAAVPVKGGYTTLGNIALKVHGDQTAARNINARLPKINAKLKDQGESFSIAKSRSVFDGMMVVFRCKSKT